MIQWLNQNQGFVMSMLTLVYVVATIIIVGYNRKSIKEMQKTREEESRPYVFAYLQKDPRDLCFYLQVKNYGKTGAYINNLSIKPDLKFNGQINTEKFLNNVVLAPGQMLQFIVLDKKEETMKRDYDVDIEYCMLTDKSKIYNEKYILVIQYAHQMGYTDSKSSNLSDEANALENIANYLDCIRNKM